MAEHRLSRTRRRRTSSAIPSSWSPSSTWWSSSSWTSSWKRWHQHRWQDDKMVTAMVSETTSNSRFHSSRTSIQETGACRVKTTSSTLSPSTRKSDRSLVPIIFLTEVAESEIRTQPVATAVSATGCVDTTLSCSREDAHFSEGTHHSAQFIQHCTFPKWAHRIDSR